MVLALLVGTTALAAQISFGSQPIDRSGLTLAPLNDFSRGLAIPALAIGALGLIFALCLAPTLLASSAPRIGKITSSLRRQSRRRYEAVSRFELAFASNRPELSSSEAPSWRAITTKRDEAAFALRQGRRIGSIVDVSRRLTGPLTVVVGLMTLIFGGSAVAQLSAPATSDSFRAVLEASILQVMIASVDGVGAKGVTVAFAVLVVTGIAGIALSTAALAEAWLCGVDGARYLRQGRVQMVRAPQHVSEAAPIELTKRGFGLRHSRLMRDPTSLNRIIAECHSILADFAQPAA